MESKESVQLVVFASQELSAMDVENVRSMLGPACRVIEVRDSGPTRLARAMQAVADEFRLTPREREVLTELVAGLSNNEIAKELGIAACTVKSHVEAIYRRTGTSGRQELCALVYSRRLDA